MCHVILLNKFSLLHLITSSKWMVHSHFLFIESTFFFKLLFGSILSPLDIQMLFCLTNGVNEWYACNFQKHIFTRKLNFHLILFFFPIKLIFFQLNSNLIGKQIITFFLRTSAFWWQVIKFSFFVYPTASWKHLDMSCWLFRPKLRDTKK